jgi:hypothetical protein
MAFTENANLAVDGAIMSTRRKDSRWLVPVYKNATMVERFSGHRAAWCRGFEVCVTPLRMVNCISWVLNQPKKYLLI